MSLLSEKLRRARETNVQINGHTFTVRRPTDVEAMEFRQEHGADDALYAARLAEIFTVGWSLSEIDLGIPGGGPEKVPFDVDAWREYIAVHPELWAPLSTKILDAYTAYAAKREGAEKNS
jgi:hypothetical protein